MAGLLDYIKATGGLLGNAYDSAVNRTSGLLSDAANYKQSLAQMLDPAWQAEMRKPENMAALDKQISDFAMETGTGFVGSIGKAAGAAKTQYELAHELAQRNAALPVERGGLGLPAGNTAMDRAKATGFSDTNLYHGTNADITRFDLGRGGQTSGSQVGQLGVSSALDPVLANEFASLAGNDGANIIPLLHRFDKGARLDSESGNLTNLEMRGAVEDAWDSGLNSLLIHNYSTPKGVNGHSFVLDKDPSQLRSRFAAFDPKRRDSADLLAGVAAAPAGLLGNMAKDDANRNKKKPKK